VSDIVTALTSAVAMRSLAAPAIAYGAGVLTSAGPCLAPRIASLAAMSASAQGRQRAMLCAAFIAGLACSYAAIASSAALFGKMLAASTWIYVILALVLSYQGLRTIALASRHTCGALARARSIAPSAGCAFVSGASYAFVVSPCCTPLVVSIAGIAGSSGSYLFGIVAALAFALGHATPLLVCGLVTRLAAMFENRVQLRLAGSMVGGSVMLALGGYYALLA
jgi:cytochrome c-type biogenesis protein